MKVLDWYPQLKVIVQIALHTGMRCGEILKLRWRDVDLSRKVILVKNTKSGKDRAVPINSAALSALDSLTQRHGQRGEWLFPSVSECGHVTDIRCSWLAALEAAGIAGLHFHDLRHTAATRIGEAGATLAELMEIFGWSNPKMADRYTHVTKERLHQAVEKAAARNNCLNFVARQQGSGG
jgi:integrase